MTIYALSRAVLKGSAMAYLPKAATPATCFRHSCLTSKPAFAVNPIIPEDRISARRADLSRDLRTRRMVRTDISQHQLLETTDETIAIPS